MRPVWALEGPRVALPVRVLLSLRHVAEPSCPGLSQCSFPPGPARRSENRVAVS